MSQHIPEELSKRRYEDINPDKRDTGCLFKCGDHGEWKERLKALDYMPAILSWMNSVKEGLEKLPAVIDWMNQEKGSKSTSRYIIAAVAGTVLVGLISFALTTKSDLKQSQVDFINEATARQAEHKLQMTARQDAYEQASRDRSNLISMQVDDIKRTAEEIKLTTAIMVALSKESALQETRDRDENKQVIKRLEEQVLFHRETEPTKGKK